MLSDNQIEIIAGAAHDLNRSWCDLTGDRSQRPWASAANWQRESAIVGVRGVLAGNTPEQSHEAWLAHKQADDWVYGPEKDVKLKTHPCMVPYADLPPDHEYKDTLFVTVVQLLAAGIESFVAQPVV